MSKLISVDFLNKRVIGEIPITDNIDIKNEPLKCEGPECKTRDTDSKNFLDTQIIRNFPV